MRELTIGKNDAGQRLDRFVAKSLPLLPPTLLQKYIRLKRIKVNGRGAKRDTRLESGDILQLYINDEFFDKPSEENIFLTVFRPQLDIVYEDENLLLVNKRPGLVVHADETEKVNTLINHIQAYLYQKKEWNPKWENAFAPALCNRIDRNTGGIVIAAKNAVALREVNRLIREGNLDKRYLCAVHGRPDPQNAVLDGYLFKNSRTKTVSVVSSPIPGVKRIVTGYRTLSYNREQDLSLLEIHLETGRTHQIRAHMAWAGHPLLGEGKYGHNKEDRALGFSHQALYAYQVTFTVPDGPLAYLNGKTFSVNKENIDFLKLFSWRTEH